MATRYVLSIDGGGMYGIIPATWCTLIEQQTGKAMGALFDFMAGTSTGSILTSAFSTGRTAEEAVKIYLDKGQEIFKDPRPFILQLFRPKFRGKYLVAVLKERLGNETMGQANNPLLLTAFDVSRNSTKYFRSWVDEDKNIKIYDAVAASSSAPTAHPMHEVNGNCYTDGGVFAKNPSMAALVEVMQMWPDDDYVLLSLGTGYFYNDYDCSKIRQWGLLNWLKVLAEIFQEGEEGLVAYQIEHLAKALQGRLTHFRFDIRLTQKKQSDVADPEKLRGLQGLALDSIAGDQNFEKMIEVLKARAS